MLFLCVGSLSVHFYAFSYHTNFKWWSWWAEPVKTKSNSQASIAFILFLMDGIANSNNVWCISRAWMIFLEYIPFTTRVWFSSWRGTGKALETSLSLVLYMIQNELQTQLQTSQKLRKLPYTGHLESLDCPIGPVSPVCPVFSVCSVCLFCPVCPVCPDSGIVYFPNKAWILLLHRKLYVLNWWSALFFLPLHITNEFPRNGRRGIKFYNTVSS